MAKPKVRHSKDDFKNVGGTPGKLHRRLGVPEDKTIPKDRLRQAAHSRDPETRREAIHAETMAKWHHTGPKRTGKRLRDIYKK